MKNLILNGKEAEIAPLKLHEDFKALFNKEEYCNMVEKAKNIYMREIYSRSYCQTGLKLHMRAVCLMHTGYWDTESVTVYVLFFKR